MKCPYIVVAKNHCIGPGLLGLEALRKAFEIGTVQMERKAGMYNGTTMPFQLPLPKVKWMSSFSTTFTIKSSPPK